MVRKCKLECKENNVVKVTNNNVKYYENLAKKHSEASKDFAIKSEEYSKEALAITNFHIEDDKNPHDVTAEQVGAFSKAEIQEILTDELAKKNPNLVAGDNISIENNEDGTQTIGFSDTVSIDYEILQNKPSINNVLLVGNKTSSDLGLASIDDVPTKLSELQNDSGYLTQHQDISNLASNQELNEGLAKKQDELSATQVLAINSGITSGLVSKIEDVNDGVLTIQKNGVTIGTFSANSFENKTINIPESDLGDIATTDLSNLTDVGKNVFVNPNLTNISEIGKNVLDGQWIIEENSISATKTAGTYVLDLSDYLPSDEYKYEILLSYDFQAGSTEGEHIYLSSDIITSQVTLAYLSTSTTTTNSGCIIMLVGTGRNLTYTLQKKMNAASLKLLAYRRIGTNI